MSPIDLSAVQQITDIVCSYFSVTTAQLESHRRPDWLAWPRRCCMALIREFVQLDVKTTGLLLNKTHSAVTHAVQAVQADVACNAKRAAEYNALRARVIENLERTGLPGISRVVPVTSAAPTSTFNSPLASAA